MPTQIVIPPYRRPSCNCSMELPDTVYLDTFLFKFCLMTLSCWMNCLSSWLVLLLPPPGKCTLWNIGCQTQPHPALGRGEVTVCDQPN